MPKRQTLPAHKQRGADMRRDYSQKAFDSMVRAYERSQKPKNQPRLGPNGKFFYYKAEGYSEEQAIELVQKEFPWITYDMIDKWLEEEKRNPKADLIIARYKDALARYRRMMENSGKGQNGQNVGDGEDGR